MNFVDFLITNTLSLFEKDESWEEEQTPPHSVPPPSDSQRLPPTSRHPLRLHLRPVSTLGDFTHLSVTFIHTFPSQPSSTPASLLPFLGSGSFRIEGAAAGGGGWRWRSRSTVWWLNCQPVYLQVTLLAPLADLSCCPVKLPGHVTPRHRTLLPEKQLAAREPHPWKPRHTCVLYFPHVTPFHPRNTYMKPKCIDI